ncbi:hypothetical protein [Streptomyces sp. NPDC005209]|uniref:hypothetical protein n=1 Tax=Streptomyces sp. NPDC005209 TaxID=3156715 RepID=UPI0033B7060F
MGRISDDTRARNEESIRAAMDRMLRGDLPPGGKCDLNTLATQAGVTRTAFYPEMHRDGTTRPGPYQHLAEEFDRRLKTLQEAGEILDPRLAQVSRLKEANATLKERLAKQEAELAELTEFKHRALSRIAAQHLEIERCASTPRRGARSLPSRPGSRLTARSAPAADLHKRQPNGHEAAHTMCCLEERRRWVQRSAPRSSTRRVGELRNTSSGAEP